MADERCADPLNSLEVDLMILDYLMYSATKTLLDVRKEQTIKAASNGRRPQDVLISLVDSFRVIFSANHPEHQADEHLELNLRLLKFVALFTQRCYPCSSTPPAVTLKDMRQQEVLRRKDWLRYRRIMPMPVSRNDLPNDHELLRNRQDTLTQLCIDQPGAINFFGTPSSVSLLDLLPMFISLSAFKAEQESYKISSAWMDLAANFMLHAALEQYRIIGTHQVEPVQGAFAWGWIQHETWGDSSEEEMVNEMFRELDEDCEISMWTKLRQEYMRELIPSGEGMGNEHLARIAQTHPLVEFEATMLSFLEGMLKTLKSPVLVQMEKGKLEGFSRTETVAFKTRLGWK